MHVGRNLVTCIPVGHGDGGAIFAKLKNSAPKPKRLKFLPFCHAKYRLGRWVCPRRQRAPGRAFVNGTAPRFRPAGFNPSRELSRAADAAPAKGAALARRNRLPPKTQTPFRRGRRRRCVSVPREGSCALLPRSRRRPAYRSRI